MWLVSFKINGRLKKACSPNHTHTHTYIRSKYSTWANTATDLEIYKRVWTHSWAIGSHLSAPRRLTFLCPSLCRVATGLHFLHYQRDRSFCFWDGSVRFPLGVSVVSSRPLLLKKYAKSHDNAAAGHPGTLPLTWRWEITFSSNFRFKLLLFPPITKGTNHSWAYLSWHTSRKFLEAYRTKVRKY